MTIGAKFELETDHTYRSLKTLLFHLMINFCSLKGEYEVKINQDNFF